jgi:hypothetical protein
VQAQTGVHDYILTITDDDGARHFDTVNVVVNSLYSTDVWLEAECGTVGSNFNTNDDADASNGAFIEVIAGTELTEAPSEDAIDLAQFEFTLPESGTFKLWGRVRTPSANDDSFWVRMDNGEWVMWNSIPAGSDWHWDDVHDSNNESAVVEYDLDAGNHTLTLCYREDGAGLDKLYLTNSGAVPTGIGGTADNCPSLNDSDFSEEPVISLYPNPAQDEVRLISIAEFTSLKIYTTEGRLAFEKEYGMAVHSDELMLNFEPGVYIVQLRNEKELYTARLIIE